MHSETGHFGEHSVTQNMDHWWMIMKHVLVLRLHSSRTNDIENIANWITGAFSHYFRQKRADRINFFILRFHQRVKILEAKVVDMLRNEEIPSPQHLLRRSCLSSRHLFHCVDFHGMLVCWNHRNSCHPKKPHPLAHSAPPYFHALSFLLSKVHNCCASYSIAIKQHTKNAYQNVIIWLSNIAAMIALCIIVVNILCFYHLPNRYKNDYGLVAARRRLLLISEHVESTIPSSLENYSTEWWRRQRRWWWRR